MFMHYMDESRYKVLGTVVEYLKISIYKSERQLKKGERTATEYSSTIVGDYFLNK